MGRLYKKPNVNVLRPVCPKWSYFDPCYFFRIKPIVDSMKLESQWDKSIVTVQ